MNVKKGISLPCSHIPSWYSAKEQG